jgi:lipopolysaccharide biosynthesis protein
MTCLEPYTVNVCSSQVAEEGRDISVTIEEIEPVKNSKGSLKERLNEYSVDQRNDPQLKVFRSYCMLEYWKELYEITSHSLAS